MISLDTNALLELAAAMRAANEQIDEAAQLLYRTTTHEDWGCKERYLINENTLVNKNAAAALQDSSRAFADAVTSTANEFAELENSISEMFNGVDVLLGSILSVGAAVQSAQEQTIHTGQWHDTSLTDPISVVRFKDLQLENGG